MFLQRRNDEFVRAVFDKHADAGTKMITDHTLTAALCDLGVHLNSEEVHELMTAMDLDNKGGLDLKEFGRSLRQPYSKIEQFVDTLPVSGMLASCLTTPGAAEPVHELCHLDSEQLSACIEACSLSLNDLLKRELTSLKELLKVEAQAGSDGSGSKYAVFSMNTGSVQEYYEGLYARIGEHDLAQMQ